MKDADIDRISTAIVQRGLADILQANDALRMDTSRLLEAYAAEDA